MHGIDTATLRERGPRRRCVRARKRRTQAAPRAGRYQPLGPRGSSRRYLCESFPRRLGPYHDGPQLALTPYFLCGIGLPQKSYRSAYREIPLKRVHSGVNFRGAAISLCSGLAVCLPPWSLPPTAVSCRRRLWLLVRTRHASYLCMPRICQPSETGNCRHGDFHPAKTRGLVGCSTLFYQATFRVAVSRRA
jgi:hypothetical protein